MKSKKNFPFSYPLLLLLLSFTFFSPTFSLANDTITSQIFIKDPAFLISSSSTFQLGFFTPPNSTARYLGIWYNQIPTHTIVWVANRDNPIKDSSGIFTISNDGNLVVLDGNDTVLWSSNVSPSSSTNKTARIFDSGNLVLEDTASDDIIWESFKHPSNKFLPSMKFITNTITKQMIKLTSWNTPSNPSTGNFSVGLEVVSIPEAVIWNNNNGDNVFWRSGPWNGQSFIGIPEMDSVYLTGFNLVIQDKEYTFSVTQNYTAEEFGFLFLTSKGNFVQLFWNPQETDWNYRWIAQQTECDYYGTCGAYGVCDPTTSPICGCLKGFKPKNEKEWNGGNWSGGCVRRRPLQCINGSAEEDGFLAVEMAKLPYFVEWSNLSFTEDDCKQDCLSNCSCNAYAYDKGIGCMLWRRDELIDIQKFESGGATLYFRVPYAELDHTKFDDKKWVVITSVVPVSIVILIIIALSFWWICKTRKIKLQTTSDNEEERILKLTREDGMIELDIKLEDVPLYDFEELETATNNFDTNNKLGQGGFGPVYKGILLNGQEIAVKRLSRTSKQGYDEFINEVRVISKLQHRNLVRLLGCCMQREEKMLIYEYMPLLSLDAFIFGSSKQIHLDWRQRFNIIDGIARGLLYLHRDSRLKIIHRDLKTNNILLDQDLNPKISDFGLARIFYGNEVHENTQIASGTPGYMSPEYAMQGIFSEKSDVFSFGVLMLEIISGKNNTGFYGHKEALSLLGFTWKLWMEDNVVPLIEPTIYKLCYEQEMLKCIQVGLLCVQEVVKHRPNISTVISMLNSEMVNLPSPKEPGFIGRPYENYTESSQQNLNKGSVNNLTLTTIIAR